MSAAISPTPTPSSTSQPKLAYAPSEAFGQTGIRQYIGSFLALALAAVTAVSVAMWVRSQNTADVIDVYHPAGQTRVSSVWGRLLIRSLPTQPEPEWTWYYSARTFRTRGTDPWQPSIWRTLGVEMRFQPPDSMTGRRGWWLRVRWRTLVVLAAIWPIVHSIKATRMARATRYHRGADTPDRYCGRCGRWVNPSTEACGHCGRRL